MLFGKNNIITEKRDINSLFDERLDMMIAREAFEEEVEEDPDEIVEDEMMNALIDKLPETDIDSAIEDDDDDSDEDVEKYVGTPLEGYLSDYGEPVTETVPYIATWAFGGPIGAIGFSVYYNLKLQNFLRGTQLGRYMVAEAEKILSKNKKRYDSYVTFKDRFNALSLTPPLKELLVGYWNLIDLDSPKYGRLTFGVFLKDEIERLSVMIHDKQANTGGLVELPLPKDKSLLNLRW